MVSVLSMIPWKYAPDYTKYAPDYTKYAPDYTKYAPDYTSELLTSVAGIKLLKLLCALFPLALLLILGLLDSNKENNFKYIK